MRHDWQQQFDGWEDRCRAIALFDALLGVQRLHGYHGIDLRAVALAVMTYILNAMLDSRRCTEEDIEDHIQDLIATIPGAQLQDPEFRNLRQAILDRLRNGGSVFDDAMPDFRPDFAPGSQLTFRFHLIESYLGGDHSDDRKIYLRLTPDGLDLMFKTKELHRELGISIAQLLFRQQVSRGTFDGALQTLRELRLEVDQRKEHLYDLNRLIYRSVQHVPTERIREIWQDVTELAERERKTFADLAELIESTRAQLEMRATAEKDRNSLDKLWQIDQGLSRVINDHSDIIRLAVETAANHREALERAIGRSLTVTTNLDQEVLDRVIAGDAPVAGLTHWLLPLFKPQLLRHFTPLRAFEPQWLGRATEQGGEDVVELDEELRRAEELRHRQDLQARVMRAASYLRPILERLERADPVQLREVLVEMDDETLRKTLEDRLFSYCMLYLHREQALHFPKILQVDAWSAAEHCIEIAALRVLLDEHPDWVHDPGGFRVLAPPQSSDVVFLPTGGRIPNFWFERIGQHERRFITANDQ